MEVQLQKHKLTLDKGTCASDGFATELHYDKEVGGVTVSIWAPKVAKKAGIEMEPEQFTFLH